MPRLVKGSAEARAEMARLRGLRVNPKSMDVVRASPRVRSTRAVGQQLLNSAMRAARPTSRGRMNDVGRKNRVVKDLGVGGLRMHQRQFYKDPVGFLKRNDVLGFDDGTPAARAAGAHFRRDTSTYVDNKKNRELDRVGRTYRTAARTFRAPARRVASAKQSAALARGRTARAANVARRRAQLIGQRGGQQGQQQQQKQQQQQQRQQVAGFWW